MAGYQERKNDYTTMPEIHNGFEAFHACSRKTGTWEFHCHDFYEFYIHIHGGRYFAVDSDLYQLEPNQIYIIPPFCMHGLSGIEEMKDYERAYLNISSDALQVLGCRQMDLNSFFRTCISRGLNRLQLNTGDAQRLVGLISELQRRQEEENTELARFQHYSLLVSFLSELCSVIERGEALRGAAMVPGIMQHVLTYLNNNYTQPVKIADLARQFNISVSYLSHEFVRYTNRSIYDYVLYRRVMLAQELMHTDASLNSIAYQCGFNDYSNFLRMFGKIAGMSPRQYRNQLRGQQERG